MNIDNNYKERLLKRALKSLVNEIDNCIYTVDTKTVSIVRNTVRLVNKDTKIIQDNLVFVILTCCTIIETASNYEMPPSFQELTMDLVEDIKKYIKNNNTIKQGNH